MTLSNWLGIILTALILFSGIFLYCYFRRKVNKMDGFEGIVTERGAPPRRNNIDWNAEEKRLTEELSNHDKQT